MILLFIDLSGVAMINVVGFNQNTDVTDGRHIDKSKRFKENRKVLYYIAVQLWISHVYLFEYGWIYVK